MPSVQSSLDNVSNKSALRNSEIVFSKHDCGREYLTIQCSACGYRRKIMAGSRDRTCPECAKYFYNLHYQRHYNAVKNMKEPKFLTLTWKPVKKQDALTVRKMGKCLTKFLHRKPYASIWKAILAVVECKKTKKGLYYYHIHIILDGKYVPQAQISQDWKEVSGFPIVYIEKIYRTYVKAYRYILKYILKGFVFKNSKERSEFKASMKSVHYVRSYGYFRDYKESPHVYFPCPECNSVKSWIVLEFCSQVDLIEGRSYNPR